MQTAVNATSYDDDDYDSRVARFRENKTVQLQRIRRTTTGDEIRKLSSAVVSSSAGANGKYAPESFIIVVIIRVFGPFSLPFKHTKNAARTYNDIVRRGGQ